MSRLPRLLRLMHTTNRQIPNPGQGGAPPTPSISPSTHEHHLPPRPQTDHLGPDPTHVLDPIGHEVSPSPSGSSSTLAALHAAKFTPKGKSIPTRPARAMSVQLPSGEPEPKTYPPGDEYFASLSERKQRQHPLWQFFHVPLEAKATLDTKASGPPQNMGSLELLGDDDDNIKSGRAWSAAELRQKSFADLHTLWYVLLKERNVIATQREERRRLGLSSREGGDLITKRAFKCRKSMARIKYVLNERRLGLIAAATPQLQRPAAHIPWSAMASSDPFAAVAAARGGAPLPIGVLADETPGGQTGTEEAVVPEEQVAQEEVESRDEGFGGGQEAKEFVEQVKVEDGHVEKKL